MRSFYEEKYEFFFKKEIFFNSLNKILSSFTYNEVFQKVMAQKHDLGNILLSRTC